MNSEDRHERNLKIFRLSRAGYTAREISEVMGLSLRHVQRITVEMRGQHRDWMERLASPDEPRGLGRARALEALESLRQSMLYMFDIVGANEPDLPDALLGAYNKDLFDNRLAEIEVALSLLPETPDSE
jgi:hypothetical protein